MGGLGGCVYPEPDPGPMYHARAIELALERGNVDLARSSRTRALRRQGSSGTVLWWSATLSQML